MLSCRNCKSPTTETVLDLGSAPLSNSYLTIEDMQAAEFWYPLQVKLCTNCWLLQVGENVDRELMFNNTYAYFSSTSRSFVEHARRYVDTVVKRFSLREDSLVAEIASNDGYLLQFFNSKKIPCYGVEPTQSTADAAIRDHQLDILVDFFGDEFASDLAEQGRSVDLLIANNVLAHVPDIQDFVRGIANLLKPTGVATVEFPNVVELVRQNLFDTVYHEHYSYLSLSVVERIAAKCGLKVFDVEELAVHGGSLRVFLTSVANDALKTESSVTDMLTAEQSAGVNSPVFYAELQSVTDRCKDELLAFLIEAKKNGKIVAAYGAAAKGNTILNYAGIRPDLIQFVVDKAESKQHKFMPGSRIPIVAPEVIGHQRPDYLLILPWNIADEVMKQEAGIVEWGGKFVVAVPKLEVLDPS